MNKDQEILKAVDLVDALLERDYTLEDINELLKKEKLNIKVML